jgi:hypothetical protein
MNTARRIWQQRAGWLPGAVIVIGLLGALLVLGPGAGVFNLRYTF